MRYILGPFIKGRELGDGWLIIMKGVDKSITLLFKEFL